MNKAEFGKKALPTYPTNSQAEPIKHPRLVHWCEEISALIGDPLPTDWRDACAVQARQDHLTAVAHIVGNAAQNVLRRNLQLHRRGMALEAHDANVDTFADEMSVLDLAMRDYTHQTQRNDVLSVVHDGLLPSAGPELTTFLIDLIEGGRRL